MMECTRCGYRWDPDKSEAGKFCRKCGYPGIEETETRDLLEEAAEAIKAPIIAISQDLMRLHKENQRMKCQISDIRKARDRYQERCQDYAIQIGEYAKAIENQARAIESRNAEIAALKSEREPNAKKAE